MAERKRLVCTKLGHHARRDLGTLMMLEAGFTLDLKNQTRVGGPMADHGGTGGGYWSIENSHAQDYLHLWCITCRQDMRFKAPDFYRLVNTTPQLGRSTDVSVLWSRLMKEKGSGLA